MWEWVGGWMGIYRIAAALQLAVRRIISRAASIVVVVVVCLPAAVAAVFTVRDDIIVAEPYRLVLLARCRLVLL